MILCVSASQCPRVFAAGESETWCTLPSVIRAAGFIFEIASRESATTKIITFYQNPDSKDEFDIYIHLAYPICRHAACPHSRRESLSPSRIKFNQTLFIPIPVEINEIQETIARTASALLITRTHSQARAQKPGRTEIPCRRSDLDTHTQKQNIFNIYK